MTLEDGYVPEAQFGRDHFTSLAYVETVLVVCGGFLMGADARMRLGRRHYRVMLQECPRPLRTGLTRPETVVMDREQGSRLHDGTVVVGHDDWHCIQDMAEAGYFMTGKRNSPVQVATAEDIEPKAWLHLSPRGREVLNALRDFKATGGSYAQFVAPQAAQVA